MSGWAWALVVYAGLALISFVPIVRVLFRPVKLNPGGPSFEDSPWFSSEGKRRLEQNVDRIYGTLVFWKTRAERYRALHLYSVIWITISSVTVPLLAQAITGDLWSKWLITVIAAHAALLLALSRTFRIEANYKAFRNGESDYYDLYRRMLDRPRIFGETESEQIDRYFEQVELVRRVVRAAETDNFPSVDEVAKPSRNLSPQRMINDPVTEKPVGGSS